MPWAGTSGRGLPPVALPDDDRVNRGASALSGAQNTSHVALRRFRPVQPAPVVTAIHCASPGWRPGLFSRFASVCGAHSPSQCVARPLKPRRQHGRQATDTLARPPLRQQRTVQHACPRSRRGISQPRQANSSSSGKAACSSRDAGRAAPSLQHACEHERSAQRRGARGARAPGPCLVKPRRPHAAAARRPHGWRRPGGRRP
jgi:hypothetical protein